MFGLERFVSAQDGCRAAVCAELRAGRKTTHWMWFVFPQLAGLGNSPMARRYAISGLAEARAYLAHPVLGARLREMTGFVVDGAESDAVALFGAIDAVKFRSCMTLFGVAAEDPGLFDAALARFYGGARDERTLQLLGGAGALGGQG
jgi:uncharacterized protein (DUF1810 family)